MCFNYSRYYVFMLVLRKTNELRISSLGECYVKCSIIGFLRILPLVILGCFSTRNPAAPGLSPALATWIWSWLSEFKIFK